MDWFRMAPGGEGRYGPKRRSILCARIAGRFMAFEVAAVAVDAADLQVVAAGDEDASGRAGRDVDGDESLRAILFF